MPTFKYSGKDPSGRNVMGKMTADQQAAVVEELRKRHVTIISVEEVKKSGLSRLGSGASTKIKKDDLVIFTRQLATMIDAGIPILQSLEAMEEQITSPYLRTVIESVHDDVQSGGSLSASFAKHPKAFDTLFINMVKVGETGGVLSQILDRVAAYMEKTLKLQRKVKSALIYPAVVVSMAIIITTVLLVKVVPTFAKIYASFNHKLPAMTQVLINTSNFLKHYILFVIGFLIILVFLLRRWYRTERGRLILDRAILQLPIFGELIRKVAISRFTRTLATLLQTGVPILESLEIVGKSSGNRVIELVVDNVKTSVREGESIAVPLSKSGVFPPMVSRMIAIGEKSGQLEKMLSKVADFYEDQVDAAVSGLTSIIEPLIIGVLGVVVGFIVVSLFLPIVNMTQVVASY